MQDIVCVTGASGYIGSWLVLELIKKGYKVHGTVRNINKSKHLYSLPGAKENLVLFEADLLQANSFDSAFQSCSGVFHTASPFFFSGITDPELQMIKPAVNGTLNVFHSVCKIKSIKKLIVTSSLAAVIIGNYKQDHLFTEEDWSDIELQKSAKMWYLLSKNLAERALWDEYSKLTNKTFDVNVINPAMVIGPLLQPTLNTSCELILKLFDGSRKTIPHANMMFVDVRDVAHSHIAVYESNNTKGRYLCISCTSDYKQICDILRTITKDIKGTNVPTNIRGFSNGEIPSYPPSGFWNFSNNKLKELGVSFRNIDEMIEDTVHSLIEKNLFSQKLTKLSSSL